MVFVFGSNGGHFRLSYVSNSTFLHVENEEGKIELLRKNDFCATKCIPPERSSSPEFKYISPGASRSNLPSYEKADVIRLHPFL